MVPQKGYQIKFHDVKSSTKREYTCHQGMIAVSRPVTCMQIPSIPYPSPKCCYPISDRVVDHPGNAPVKKTQNLQGAVSGSFPVAIMAQRIDHKRKLPYVAADKGTYRAPESAFLCLRQRGHMARYLFEKWVQPKSLTCRLLPIYSRQVGKPIPVPGLFTRQNQSVEGLPPAKAFFLKAPGGCFQNSRKQ